MVCFVLICRNQWQQINMEVRGLEGYEQSLRTVKRALQLLLFNLEAELNEISQRDRSIKHKFQNVYENRRSLEDRDPINVPVVGTNTMSSPTILHVENWHGPSCRKSKLAVNYKISTYRGTGLICSGVHGVACLLWSPSLHSCLNIYTIGLLVIKFPYE